MKKRYERERDDDPSPLYQCIGAWILALGLLAAIMSSALPEIFTGGPV